MKRVAVIGGGLIGLATAYKLLEKFPDLRIDVYEKEARSGVHQSGRNSGVLHCGLYYKPGSLKAQLAVSGIRQMVAFCKKHEIDHEICGKIVVATNEEQVKTLNSLARNGEANGLDGLKFLNKNELKLREPTVVAHEALLVPEEGIVDFKAVMTKLVDLIETNGGKVYFNSPVLSAHETAYQEVVIQVNSNAKSYDMLISCAGLYSDRLYSKFTDKKRPVRIIPFRGEYHSFKPEFNSIVNNLVYPVPDAKYPFLGVHFTRMISGEREVGPNAVLAFKREGYSFSDFSIKDTLDSVTYIGLINFIRKNPRFVVDEIMSSIFTDAFLKKAKSIIPDVNSTMFVKGSSGVRAQALDANGQLMMDFNVQRIGNQIHVLNAPSPGATASLAIASHIIDKYLTDLN